MILQLFYKAAQIKKTLFLLTVVVSSFASASLLPKLSPTTSKEIKNFKKEAQEEISWKDSSITPETPINPLPNLTLEEFTAHLKTNNLKDSPIIINNYHLTPAMEKTLLQKLKKPGTQSDFFDPAINPTEFALRFYYDHFHWGSNKALFSKYHGFHKGYFNKFSDKKQPEIQAFFYYDLMYSLLQSAEASKLIIRPDIEIFLLPESVITKKTEIYTDVKNFSYSFTVVNLNASPKELLRRFTVPPQTERKYTIKLQRGKLKHVPRQLNSSFQYWQSWNIIPYNKETFQVTIEEKNTKDPVVFEREYEHLSLIYSHSLSSNNPIFDVTSEESIQLPDLGFINSATFEDFEKIIQPKLQNLTAADIKKDIELWYGSFNMAYVNAAQNDLAEIIKFLTKDIDENAKGEKISTLKKIFTNSSFRNTIYTVLRLPEALMILIDELAQSFKAEENGPLEIEAFFWSFLTEIKELQKNTKLELIWVEEPTTTFRDVSTNNPYPRVNYKFKQKWTFHKDVSFTFKGGWDISKKKLVVHSDTQKKGTTYFNLPEKIQNPEIVFKSMIKFLSGSAGTGFYIDLFKDTKSFIGWDVVKIPKTDSIEFTYKATNSQIEIAILNKKDFYNWKQGQIMFGWKAFNTIITHDFSNFFTIFAELFSKLECYKSVQEADKNGFSVSELISFNSFKAKVLKNPFSTIAHVINSIFGIGYTESKAVSGSSSGSSSSTTAPTTLGGGGDSCAKPTSRLKRSAEAATVSSADKHKERAEEHPWYLFFSTLLKNTFHLKNREMLFGFPTILYDLPATYETKLKEIMEKKKKEVTDAEEAVINIATNASKTETYYYFSYKEINQKINSKDNSTIFPAELKSKKLNELSKHTLVSIGFSYPHTPLILPSVYQYRDELKKHFDSNPKFKTTKNLDKNSAELKKYIFDFLKNNTWAKSNDFSTYNQNTWKKPINIFDEKLMKQSTLSFFTLDLKGALNAVLGMKLNLGVIGSVALVGAGVTVSDILGDAIKRDLIWICLALNSGPGSWLATVYPATKFVQYTPKSEILFTLLPNFVKSELNLGSIISS